GGEALSARAEEVLRGGEDLVLGIGLLRLGQGGGGHERAHAEAEGEGAAGNGVGHKSDPPRKLVQNIGVRYWKTIGTHAERRLKRPFRRRLARPSLGELIVLSGVRWAALRPDLVRAFTPRRLGEDRLEGGLRLLLAPRHGEHACAALLVIEPLRFAGDEGVEFGQRFIEAAKIGERRGAVRPRRRVIRRKLEETIERFERIGGAIERDKRGGADELGAEVAWIEAQRALTRAQRLAMAAKAR